MTWDSNAGRKVDDTLPPLWPGSDPFPGTGIAGRVRGYTQAESTKPGQKGEKYTVLELDGAVIHTPSYNGRPSTLIRHTSYALAVPAWLQRLLTPELTPVGTYVAITYVGMHGQARKMELRITDKPYLARLWKAAESDTARAAAGDSPASKPAPSAPAPEGDDDLPF